jgi:hypothetical protein
LHRRQVGADFAILGGYLVLAAVMTWPMARDFARAIPGDGFDGWQNFWNLWWVRIALVEQHTTPFFTNLLFYPTGVSLLFHTLNLLNGLLTLPLQLVFGLFPAYNSVVLFSFAMGGFGAYLLARSSLGRQGARLPAFVAGVVFSFSPFHFAHLLGHMQVISLEWIPFYALYLLKVVSGRQQARARYTNILLAALFLALIGLCDLYYVLYCLIFTVVVLCWSAWRAWRASIDSRGRSEAAAAVRRTASGRVLPLAVLSTGAVWLLFGLALSPQLFPMIAEAQHSSYMVPDPAQSRVLSADLLAFVTPQEFHPLWGAWAAERGKLLAASPAEHQVFAGFTVLLLAAVGLWRGWRGPSRGGADTGPWPLILLVFIVLALGPVLHVGGRSDILPGGGELRLPYGWLAHVIPFMDITRSVSRFDVMVMLALSILVSAALQWLWGRRRAGRIAAFAAVGLVLFEFLPAPYPMSLPDAPDWYATLAKDPRPGAVLNLPMAWDRPGYLLDQTVHGKPLTVAYISRDDPRTLTQRAPVLQQLRNLRPDVIDFDLAAQGRQVLADLGVRWVVVDRYQMPSGEERLYTDAATARIFEGQAPIYEDDRITVYEVAPIPQPAPYLLLGEGWGPLQPAIGARSFHGTATVVVRSPAEDDLVLLVVLAPGARLDLPGVGDRYEVALHVGPGDNVVTLRTDGATQEATVTSLALSTGATR